MTKPIAGISNGQHIWMPVGIDGEARCCCGWSRRPSSTDPKAFIYSHRTERGDMPRRCKGSLRADSATKGREPYKPKERATGTCLDCGQPCWGRRLRCAEHHKSKHPNPRPAPRTWSPL